LNLEKYLDELRDLRKPLVISRLTNLSNLSQEELRLFKARWASIEVKRRREILGWLTELAEDNFELDFYDVFHICLHDEDAIVRVKAIEGLWECEDRGLIAPLIELMKSDSEESVRAAAATALGRFALLGELNKLRPGDVERVGNALLGVIDNPGEQVEVRRRALEAIAPLSMPRVKEIISEAYHSGEPRFIVSALYAMGRNCDPIWLPTLLKELSSPDPARRFEAVRACGELEDESAVPYLIKLIDDIDTHVQLCAIEALGHIGGGEARRALHRCLDNPDERIRQAAEEVLGEMEFEEGLSWF